MKRSRHVRMVAVCATLVVGVVAAAWVATAATNDPVTVARISLVIDGSEIATFSDLGGIVSGIDPAQLELSGGSVRLPGKRTPPTVTLTRGMTNDAALWSWHDSALAGDAAARKNAELVFYSPEGVPVARFDLQHAWPSKLEVGAVKAGASEVLMETVTIVCEHIQRVSV
jgi:phage tail-like protein